MNIFDFFSCYKKQILIIIITICIWIGIGFLIATSVSDAIAEQNEVYQKALKIDNDKDQFGWCMEVNSGNAIVYGEIKAVDAVKIKELTDEYIYIKKTIERYTKHIRNSGKTTYVEYSWDYVDHEESKSKEITILDYKFNSDLFSFENINELDLNDKNVANSYYENENYIYDKKRIFAKEADIRYSFEVVPKSFYGSFFAKLSDKTVSSTDKDKISISSMNLNDYYNSLLSSVTRTLVLLWIGWILIFAVIFVFILVYMNV